MWNKYKKYIISLFIGSAVLAGGLSLQEQKKEMPDHLKLKADKSKILAVSEVDDIKCDLDGNCENKGKIKWYQYISDKKLAKEKITYDGKEIEEDISKRTSNALFFPVTAQTKNVSFYSKFLNYCSAETGFEDGVWIGKFFVGDPFYNDGSDWYQTEYATTTIEAYEEQTATTTAEAILNLFGKTAVAQVSTTTQFTTAEGRGSVRKTTSWSAAVSATDADDMNTVNDTIDGAIRYGAGYYDVSRNFYTYNTSAIGSGSTVTSATSSIRLNIKGGSDAGQGFNIYNSSHSDTLTTADFDQAGTTAWSTTFLKSSWTSGAYHAWVFNASGLTGINKTGSTKLALREANRDVANTQPADTTNNYIYLWTTYKTGTDYDPYLMVTWTTGGGGGEAPIDSSYFINFSE